MDAFLINEFEEHGAERIPHSSKHGDWGAEFGTLDLLVRAVANVSWKLGVAQVMLDNMDPGVERTASDAAGRRLLAKAERDLGSITVVSYGTSVILA